jgi:hypothetical protein
VRERFMDVADGQVGHTLAARVRGAVDDAGRTALVASFRHGNAEDIGHGAPDIMAGSTAEVGSGTHDSNRRSEVWRAVEREGRSTEKGKGEEIRRVVIAAQSDRYRSNGEQESPHTQSHREPPHCDISNEPASRELQKSHANCSAFCRDHDFVRDKS